MVRSSPDISIMNGAIKIAEKALNNPINIVTNCR